MNDFDKDNLDFFLHGNSYEFEEWMNDASDSDLSYALRLIRQAKAELVEKSWDLLDSVENTDEANEILKAFTYGRKRP